MAARSGANTESERSSKIRTAVGLVALAFALGACAELSFKAGATPGDMQRDEQACRSSSAEDEDAFIACMKERGYLITKKGETVTWGPAAR